MGMDLFRIESQWRLATLEGARPGGQPVQLTRKGGREGFESADGKFVYYVRALALQDLESTTEGGDETLVLTESTRASGVCWTRCLFINPDTAPHAEIEFYSFATGRTTKVSVVEKELQLVYPSLAVSHDGKSLLYVQTDSFESDIMLVETSGEYEECYPQITQISFRKR